MVSEISVIIPAYNRASLIGETLRSLLNQTVPAKEIIVVDDGSTDGTAERTLEAFENWKLETGDLKKDGREQFSGNSKFKIQNPTLKILRQANAGPAAARNRGLAEATGEFIHFFDSDDIAAPNKHEVQLKALLETGADIAYGPWVKGRFAPKEAQTVACGELSVANSNLGNTRNPQPATRNPGFHPEGPVLQALGLPKGNLVKALLTSWSVVPHACLFRRSILEKAGGFPEDIWVGEDQLLFLRCLLAGAKVVHTPGTMVFYRLGDEGKLTESKVGQQRRVVDWGKFLVKAQEELSSAERRGTSAGRGVRAETRREEEKAEMLKAEKPKKEGTTKDTNQHETGKIIDGKIIRTTEEEPGLRLAGQAGASEPDSLSSKLADSPVSESLTLSASGPASLPATSYSLLATAPEALTTPSAWFGFRLRVYEAWRDLRAFFPGEYLDLESGLEAIWKRNWFSGFRFQVSGFVLRKWRGLMNRIFGHRVKGGFRSGKFTSREATLFDAQ